MADDDTGGAEPYALVAVVLTPSMSAVGAVVANVVGQVTLAVLLLVVTVRGTGAFGWVPRSLLAMALVSVVAGTALVMKVLDADAPPWLRPLVPGPPPAALRAVTRT